MNIFISLSPPPLQPKSQSKLKTIEHSTAGDIVMILCNANISHSLTCPRKWKKVPKQLKRLKIEHST